MLFFYCIFYDLRRYTKIEEWPSKPRRWLVLISSLADWSARSLRLSQCARTTRSLCSTNLSTPSSCTIWLMNPMEYLQARAAGEWWSRRTGASAHRAAAAPGPSGAARVPAPRARPAAPACRPPARARGTPARAPRAPAHCWCALAAPDDWKCNIATLLNRLSNQFHCFPIRPWLVSLFPRKQLIASVSNASTTH